MVFTQPKLVTFHDALLFADYGLISSSMHNAGM